MEAKQEAERLFQKMSSQTFSYQEYAGANYTTEEIGWEAGKKCALLAIEEMLGYTSDLNYDFLLCVKEELTKL